ncbi:18514_t:CDS:10 [Entrophospora sp. SA101]|nr:1497_t:CDS:10 [Entrophospora sp. SA101]CAJ0755944.1 18514_t:CDS:10 [Entrophospora sp. SA101]
MTQVSESLGDNNKNDNNNSDNDGNNSDPEEFVKETDQELINNDSILPNGLRRIRDDRSISYNDNNDGGVSKNLNTTKIMNHIDLARFSTESLHSYSFVANNGLSLENRQNILYRSIDFMKNKIKGWKFPMIQQAPFSSVRTSLSSSSSIAPTDIILPCESINSSSLNSPRNLKQTLTGLPSIYTPMTSSTLHSPTRFTPQNQAIITTDNKTNILSVNDITCLVFGYSRTEILSIKALELIGSPFREKLAQTLASRLQNEMDNSEAVLACGRVIPIQRKNEETSAASLWLKVKKDECGNSVFIWIFEEIIESTMTVEINEKGTILKTSGEVKSLYGYGLKIISIPTIAGVITSHATGVIQSCNSDFVKYLFGVGAQELIGKKNIDKLLPQFPHLLKFLESESGLVEGIVISENAFRRAASSSSVATSPTNLFLYNTHQRDYSSAANGTEFDVDIQMRVLEAPDEPLHALWITYDRTAGGKPSLSGKLSSVESHQIITPPSILPNSGSFDNIRYSALTLSKSINDFQIIGILGSGAYGEVKLAYNKNDPEKKKVVLKYVIKSRILVDCWTCDQLLGTVPLEIHILHTLRGIPNPNIVQMVDYFEDKDHYYIEMGLHGAGMDLFDYIELNTKMPESEIKSIFRQIARAIQHLHNHKIVHRDIKDENVILDENNNIQLIDFGSSAYIKEGKKYDTFCGTVDYAAPEVLIGKKYDGPPQDIWALGILLYTLIYKENPFYNIDEIIAGDLRIPYILSEGSIDLVKKMLERDRFSST